MSGDGPKEFINEPCKA